MTSDRGRHLKQYLKAISEIARLANDDAKKPPIVPSREQELLEEIARLSASAPASTDPYDNMEGLLRATIDLVESVLVLTKDGTQRHAAHKKVLKGVMKQLADTLP